MNDTQMRGRIEQAKGNVKEVAGAMVGNKKLERKGKRQAAAGKIQADVGDMTAAITKSIEEDGRREDEKVK
jgi:uncharacterized protein YjbJ (UPF0337 family)